MITFNNERVINIMIYTDAQEVVLAPLVAEMDSNSTKKLAFDIEKCGEAIRAMKVALKGAKRNKRIWERQKRSDLRLSSSRSVRPS